MIGVCAVSGRPARRVVHIRCGPPEIGTALALIDCLQYLSPMLIYLGVGLTQTQITPCNPSGPEYCVTPNISIRWVCLDLGWPGVCGAYHIHFGLPQMLMPRFGFVRTGLSAGIGAQEGFPHGHWAGLRLVVMTLCKSRIDSRRGS